jgi:possible group 1 glycosyl transferase
MKIVHICHTYIDGFAYQDNELPKAHAKLGHDVTIISTLDYAGCFNYSVTQSLNNKIYYSDKCKIIRLALKYKSNYRFILYKGLYSILKEENPDLIYFHELPYFNYYDIIRYKKKYNCKLVVDFHCDYYNSARGFISKFILHKGLYRFINSIVKSYVDQYYAVTPGTIDFVYSMYNINREKIKLLPLGGNLDEIESNNNKTARSQTRLELGISENQLIIITAGKIDYNKKTIELIKAYKKLNNKHIDLVIIGSIESKCEKKIFKLCDNNPNIHLLGWKTPQEIYRYFIASDLGCFPGSQSAIWQQAICCGLPLICRYWPGGDYLDCGGNISFIQDDSETDIFNAIKEIIETTGTLDKMSHISKKYGKERFSYINIAQKVIDDLK